jgi:TrpR family trp operon transcriptional repressor
MSASNGWNQFLTLCRATESTQQLDQLFSLLFTLEEKDQLAMRVQLVKELLKGEKTQRQISQDLKISIAKITRGSNALKTVDESLKAFILRHTNNNNPPPANV